ncbi:MAG: hypothetical protein ACRDLF_04250 [Solirubrobacteraceae bacterium]
MLLMGMALAGTAAAAPLWLLCLEGIGLTKYSDNQCIEASGTGKWQSLGIASGKTDTVRLLAFSLQLEDTGAGTKVECNDVGIPGTGVGVIEGPNKGKITKFELTSPEKEGCKVLKGFLTCTAGKLTNVKGANLPWNTEVFTTENKSLTRILNSGAGEPGWSVTCGGATDSCVTESTASSESTELNNAVTNGVLLVKSRFESKGEAKCSVGGAKAGKVRGLIAILLWSGNGLSIAEGGGAAEEEEIIIGATDKEEEATDTLMTVTNPYTYSVEIFGLVALPGGGMILPGSGCPGSILVPGGSCQYRQNNPPGSHARVRAR